MTPHSASANRSLLTTSPAYAAKTARTARSLGPPPGGAHRDPPPGSDREPRSRPCPDGTPRVGAGAAPMYATMSTEPTKTNRQSGPIPSARFGCSRPRSLGSRRLPQGHPTRPDTAAQAPPCPQHARRPRLGASRFAAVVTGALGEAGEPLKLWLNRTPLAARPTQTVATAAATCDDHDQAPFEVVVVDGVERSRSGFGLIEVSPRSEPRSLLGLADLLHSHAVPALARAWNAGRWQAVLVVERRVEHEPRRQVFSRPRSSPREPSDGPSPRAAPALPEDRAAHRRPAQPGC